MRECSRRAGQAVNGYLTEAGEIDTMGGFEVRLPASDAPVPVRSDAPEPLRVG